MDTRKALKNSLDLVTKQQEAFVELANQIANTKNMSSRDDEPTAKKCLDLFKKAEERNRQLLLAVADHVPDDLEKKIREATKKRPFSIEPESLFAEIEKIVMALEVLGNAIDQRLLEFEFLPHSTECTIHVAKGITANPGFRCVKKGNEVFYLTFNEGKVVEYLYKLHKEGRPDASQEEAISYLHRLKDREDVSGYTRVRDIFQSTHSKSAYNALIKKGETKGTIRLNTDLPTDSSLSA